MSDTATTTENDTSARILPAAGAKLPAAGAILKWQGRTLPMTLERGNWRIRSRAKSFPVDLVLPTGSLVEAKRMAKEKLDAMPAVKQEKAKGTLEDAAALYLKAPKRCGEDSAEGNVSRLRSVVRHAWAKTLDQVALADLPDLWPAYVAARQGKPRPDYATRAAGNRGINSAMKQAASVFLPSLGPEYRRAGIPLPEGATTIIWCAVSPIVQAEAKDDALVAAWRKLREKHLDLWLAVGLARFAGLRQSEILACRGKWIVAKGAVPCVQLKDWPEDGYQTKTGKSYTAMILDPELAAYLAAVPPEAPIISRTDADRWIQRKPQAWLRKYTGDAKAPLHRCRGLYVDAVKALTESAILARQEAIAEASRNVGHTSTTTTTEHYLANDGMLQRN